MEIRVIRGKKTSLYNLSRALYSFIKVKTRNKILIIRLICGITIHKVKTLIIRAISGEKTSSMQFDPINIYFADILKNLLSFIEK
ncbi:hypothetical protein AB674_09800 [Flavobacterium sp. ABG]|nr:hypothetical protein AB674_09800 [Flavobacterium sp. ABG]